MSSVSRLVYLALTLLFVVPLFAGDKQQSDQYSNLHFVVVKDANDKPVRNASVVLHPVKKDGSQSKGGFQLKTDNEGNAATEGIPYGPLRIQVLAPGFQTFGEDYQVNEPTMDIHIRLKRPGEQFSIYDKSKKTEPVVPPPAAQTPAPESKPN